MANNNLERSKRIVLKNKEEINPKNMILLDKYERFMNMKELSEGSIYNYLCDLKQWLIYVANNQYNMPVKDMTQDEIEEFIFYCKQQGNNVGRIKRRMSSISTFFKFLRMKKEIAENPMEFIPRPKKGLPVVQQTYLTQEQVKEMKDKIRESKDLRLLLYVSLSLSTMARVNAISNITWKQVNLQERMIPDVLEKEGKIVELVFSPEVKDLFIEYKSTLSQEAIDNEYVFAVKYSKDWKKPDTTTLRKWTKKAGEIIGIDGLHPHDFRHTQATLLNNAGMPIEQISELLNHEGLDVTNKFYIKKDKKKIRDSKDKYEV